MDRLPVTRVFPAMSPVKSSHDSHAVEVRMLSLTTLLPTPHGGRVQNEQTLWERVVQPFLQGLGYGVEHVRRHRDASWVRGAYLLNHSPFMALQPDVLLLLEVGRSIPGELLDQALGMAASLPVVPPLVALVYPQRAGFVLAAFVTHSRLPWGGAFPEPQELLPLVQGLRQQVSADKGPTTTPWAEQWARLLASMPEQAESEQVTALLSHAALAQESLDVLVGWSDALLVAGDNGAALKVLELLSRHTRVQADARALARVQRDQGLALLALQHWAEAEQSLLKALDGYRLMTEVGAWGATLLDLAAVQLGQQKPDSAEMLMREALSIAQQHNDQVLEAAALNNLARSWIEQERLLEAAEALEKALVLTQAQGQPREEVFTRYNLAAVYQQLGRTEAAQRLVKEVRRLGAALGPIE